MSRQITTYQETIMGRKPKNVCDIESIASMLYETLDEGADFGVITAGAAIIEECLGTLLA